MHPLTLAAWDVHSILDNLRSNRSDRRAELIALELACYKVDIAALSETRFSEQGQLEEVGASYTLLWSGHPIPDNQLTQRLEDLPAADENASVEALWCRLGDAVHSTVPGVLGRARRQHQDWFDESDTAISNLLAEKNRLHRAYLDLPTDRTRQPSTNVATLRNSKSHSRRITTLQQESIRLRRNHSRNLPARRPPPDRPTHDLIVALRTGSSGFQGRNHCSPLQAQRQAESLRQSQGHLNTQHRRKIFTRVLFNRLNGHIELRLLPESRCDFRLHGGTPDMMFAAAPASGEVPGDGNPPLHHLRELDEGPGQAEQTDEMGQREGVSDAGRTCYVCNNRSGGHFLTYTSAQLSVIPPTAADHRCPNIGLQIVNTSPTAAFSTCSLSPKIDLWPLFPRVFVVTEFSLPLFEQAYLQLFVVRSTAVSPIYATRPPVPSSGIAIAKAKRKARKTQVPRLLSTNHPPLPACLRCQRAFRARIGLVGHLRNQCAISPTTSTSSPTLAPASNPSSTTAASIIIIIIIIIASSRAPPTGGTTSDVSLYSKITNIPTSGDVDSAHACSHCDCTFTSHVGLVGHSHIHYRETG
ncbi:hypothetical protein SprV_0902757700 [Sparganum proliferum]